MESDSDVIDNITRIMSEQPSFTSLYLVKKRNTEDENKKFEPSMISIVNDPPEFFKDVLQNTLHTIKSNLEESSRRFIGFFDESIRSDDVTSLNVDNIVGFKEMINKINNYDQIVSIRNLSNDINFHFYACEFQFEGNRVIYFRRTSYGKLISREGLRNWFSFLDGRFTQVSGDIFTFDRIVDCVYFESSNSLLILDKSNMENMFDFKDYYIKYAKGKLQNLHRRNLINISDEMLDLEDKLLISKRITSIDKNNRFNKTIENFQKCKDFFDEHEGEYKEEYTQLDIRENKLYIDTKEKLETFVYLSNQDILRDIMTDELFISIKKESLRRD